jgi:hypothetical protein
MLRAPNIDWGLSLYDDMHLWYTQLSVLPSSGRLRNLLVGIRSLSAQLAQLLLDPSSSEGSEDESSEDEYDGSTAHGRDGGDQDGAVSVNPSSEGFGTQSREQPADVNDPMLTAKGLVKNLPEVLLYTPYIFKYSLFPSANTAFPLLTSARAVSTRSREFDVSVVSRGRLGVPSSRSLRYSIV